MLLDDLCTAAAGASPSPTSLEASFKKRNTSVDLAASLGKRGEVGGGVRPIITIVLKSPSPQ